MSIDTTSSEASSQIQLDIGGMTCASCAARIEKKLNRMDGVTASVNYTTEKAKVTFADTVTADDLISQIEETGCTARLPRPSARTGDDTVGADASVEDPTALLRQRLIISAVLAAPVIALAMIPGVAVRRVAMALAHPRGTCCGLGRMAVPQGGLDEPASRRQRPWTP